MIAQHDDKKSAFLLNCGYAAVILLLIWIVFKYLLPWFMPFILGYLIAAIVQPAVRLLHIRLHINRRVGGVLTVLLFVLILTLLLSLCITKAVTELAAVAGLLPDLIMQFADSVENLSQRVSGYLDSLPVEYSGKLAAWLSGMAGKLMQLSSLSDGTLSFALNLAARVPGLLLDGVIMVVSACFMGMDYGNIRGFVLRQLPIKYQDWVCDIKNFFFITVAKLIRAYLTLMAITFLELLAGLYLLRVPHAVVLAAVIAIVDLMPVLGTGSVMIPWAVIELITGNLYLGVCLLVLYAIIAIVRNILEPKIVGHHIGLYPLVTLMALFIGLRIFGFAGMLLFPIIVILIKHMQDTGRIRLWKD